MTVADLIARLANIDPDLLVTISFLDGDEWVTLTDDPLDDANVSLNFNYSELAPDSPEALERARAYEPPAPNAVAA